MSPDTERMDRGESLSAMEPLLIEDASRQRASLSDLAFELIRLSAGFRRSLPPAMQPPLAPNTGRPYNPVVTLNGWSLPWRMKAGVKEFHLVAEPVVRELAPGMKAIQPESNRPNSTEGTPIARALM